MTLSHLFKQSAKLTSLFPGKSAETYPQYLAANIPPSIESDAELKVTRGEITHLCRTVSNSYGRNVINIIYDILEWGGIVLAHNRHFTAKELGFVKEHIRSSFIIANKYVESASFVEEPVEIMSMKAWMSVDYGEQAGEAYEEHALKGLELRDGEYGQTYDRLGIMEEKLARVEEFRRQYRKIASAFRVPEPDTDLVTSEMVTISLNPCPLPSLGDGVDLLLDGNVKFSPRKRMQKMIELTEQQTKYSYPKLIDSLCACVGDTYHEIRERQKSTKLWMYPLWGYNEILRNDLALTLPFAYCIRARQINSTIVFLRARLFRISKCALPWAIFRPDKEGMFSIVVPMPTKRMSGWIEYEYAFLSHLLCLMNFCLEFAFDASEFTCAFDDFAPPKHVPLICKTRPDSCFKTIACRANLK